MTPAGTGTAAAVAAQLDPVRESLLAQARQDASELLREATAEASRTVAAAEERARVVIDEARGRGRRDGAALVAGDRAASRRAAREVVLRAQRDAYDLLRDRARERVRDAGLPAGPDPTGTAVEELVDRAIGDLGEEVAWLWTV